MGGEFAQWEEWSHEASLDWHLLQYPPHKGVQRWVRDLNRLYRAEPALHEMDFEGGGFEWVDTQDWRQSVLNFLRRGRSSRESILQESILVVSNFTPVPRHNYRVGVPEGGVWREVLNSDAVCYGGSGQGNLGSIEAAPVPIHGRSFSLSMTLPPLGILFLKRERPNVGVDKEDAA